LDICYEHAVALATDLRRHALLLSQAASLDQRFAAIFACRIASAL
jgi:hypothetical protein